MIGLNWVLLGRIDSRHPFRLRAVGQSRVLGEPMIGKLRKEDYQPEELRLGMRMVVMPIRKRWSV